ncbi:MAG: oxidoreductase [Methylobacteriaceae bacterium]|jgi:acrylyl-CoA reductase (NADPH)|nr:oxidoreductase [Methylobacteriaceae bacterium]
MSFFKALVIDKSEQGQSVVLRDFDEEGLMEGDVTVRVAYSNLNYKDGLALTGMAPVVKRFPMIPGTDFAGVVETSDNPRFAPGDKVLLTGWGVGEKHLGALAEKARVKADWLIPLPEGLSMLDAMTIGSTGFTAMLCVMALERSGVKPEQGPAVVTGATGRISSVATMLLSGSGWTVHAVTGRAEDADYLKSLGAVEILARNDFITPGKPMNKERWIAAIDTAGSHILANILAHMRYGGVVASCGATAGMDLQASVAPIILRSLSLLGVDSVMCPIERRMKAWSRLAREVDVAKLAPLRLVIPLSAVIETAKDIAAKTNRGRVVVAVNPTQD